LKMKDFDLWADKMADALLEADHTCSLDLADEGARTLSEIGKILGVTRERVRQIEIMALDSARVATAELLATTKDLRAGIVEAREAIEY
jgi:hypothetical protein